MTKIVKYAIAAMPVVAMAVLMALAGGGIARAAGDSWTPAGWGGGGLFWAAAFHPTNPDIIYMGGDVAGVYKTEDAGKHWRLINNGLSGYAVYSLVVAVKDPDTVYVGTTVGLCKSIDGGKSWQPLASTDKAHLNITAEREKSVRAIAIDPTNSRIVYAGTPRGTVFKSADGGQTWSLAYTCPSGGSVSVVTVSALHTTSIFAATSADGVVVSSDSGATWQPEDTPKDARSVAVAPTDPSRIYAGFAKEGLYESTDGGNTWAHCGAGIDPHAQIVEVVVGPGDPPAVYCIATAGWSGRFYASHDGGQTWVESHRLRRDFQADPTLPDDGKPSFGTDLSKPTNLAISPSDPTRLFIAANWRPCLSADSGKTWAESDRGADISVVYDIRFSGAQTYASAMDEGVFASGDAGESWRQLWPRKYDPEISGHDWRLAVWNNSGGDRILSSCSPWDRGADEVILSDDGGKTFTASRSGLPDKRPTVNTMWGQGYLRALAPDPRNPNIVYAGIDGDASPNGVAGGIFKSSDGGRTWAALPHQPASRRMFFALAVDPTDSNRLYWGACGKDGGLYRSDDAGEHWRCVFTRESWVFNVLVTPTGTIYCPGKDLWRSADHGNTWTKLTHNSGGQLVGLEVDPTNEKVLWISTDDWGEGANGFVLKTTNSGQTWTDITGDLPYRKPMILRFDPATRELWAAGVGLFKINQ